MRRNATCGRSIPSTPPRHDDLWRNCRWESVGVSRRGSCVCVYSVWEILISLKYACGLKKGAVISSIDTSDLTGIKQERWTMWQVRDGYT